MLQNFDCASCRRVYGQTDGETLRISLENGLQATIWKRFEFKCECGRMVKWHASQNYLAKNRQIAYK